MPKSGGAECNILISFCRVLKFHREDEEEMLRAVGRRVGC
jgi:hypothetical protein